MTLDRAFEALAAASLHNHVRYCAKWKSCGLARASGMPILVDLANVSQWIASASAPSSALGSAKSGCELKFNLNERIQDLFDITRLHGLFGTCSSRLGLKAAMDLSRSHSTGVLLQVAIDPGNARV